MKVYYGILSREVTNLIYILKDRSGCFIQVGSRGSGEEAERKFRRLLQSRHEGSLLVPDGNDGGGKKW